MKVVLLIAAAANAGYAAWVFTAGHSPAVGSFNVAVAVFCFGVAIWAR